MAQQSMHRHSYQRAMATGESRPHLIGLLLLLAVRWGPPLVPPLLHRTVGDHLTCGD